MATNFLLKRSGTASKRPDAASMALGELDLNYDASTGGVFYKDSAGGVVKVGPAQVGSTAPNVSPAGSAGNSVGEFWYDTGATALKIWDGTTWVTTGGGGSGTVTSIAAGTGLSGGTITTSGTISLDTACVVQPSAYTAKGTILSASAASTPTALPVGTDGQVLTACSTCSTGVVWATPVAPVATTGLYGVFCGPAGNQMGNNAGTQYPVIMNASIYCCNLGWSAGAACNTICFCCTGWYDLSLSGVIYSPQGCNTVIAITTTCNGTLLYRGGFCDTNAPQLYGSRSYSFVQCMTAGSCLTYCSNTLQGCAYWSSLPGGGYSGPQISIVRVA